MRYKFSNVKIPLNNFQSLEIFLKRKLQKQYKEVEHYQILKKSLDAREKNNMFFVYTLLIFTRRELPVDQLMKKIKINITRYTEPEFPEIDQIDNQPQAKPVIVGMGPAGLFCAIRLLEYGIEPILIDRGKKVEDREKDVSKFWDEGKLDPESNVLFGEGGAGTFSDGKLTSGNKNQLINYIKNKLVQFGAPTEIEYESMPHIGTDQLISTLTRLRHFLESKMELRFETKLNQINTDNNQINKITLNKKNVDADTVFLAIGHSAHDTYEMLHKQNIELEAKPFAIGFRIEHSQSLINSIQYGEKMKDSPYLGAANYKLTFNGDKRSVFSFCMCPGGEVICASNQEERLVINGMSNFNRDSGYANSAIVTNITVDDYYKDSPLDGLNYIKKFENKAFKLGGGDYYAPAQKVSDYIDNKEPTTLPDSTYSPGINAANLNSIYPKKINDAIKEGLASFNNKMKGFIENDALLLGAETRTSSPVRIPRKDTFEHIKLKGLYPIGEGAGYAGGIISAALDGIKAADSYASQL